MRVLSVAVIVAAVAIAAIVLLWSSSTKVIEKEQIEAMESSLGQVQQRLDHMDELIQEISDKIATPAQRPTQTKRAPEGPAGARRGEATKPADVDIVRGLVREEIKRIADEERRKQEEAEKYKVVTERGLKAYQWELDDFGDYAWQVHKVGKQLDLTDEQKRQYYEAYKDYYEKIHALLDQAAKSYPDNADFEQRQKYVEEQGGMEVQEALMESLRRILTPEQWEKFEETERKLREK